MERQQLFGDFSPVTKAQWEKKIQQDLKGFPYGKLIAHLDEGFDVQPFYQREDLKKLDFLQSLPGQFPFVRGKKSGGNRWQVNQVFPVTDPEKTNREVLQAVKKGVDTLTFVFDKNFQTDTDFLQRLLQGIEPEITPLHFRGVAAPALLAKVLQKLADPDKIKGSFENDPLANYNLHGIFNEKKPFVQMAENIRMFSMFPAFRSVTIDGTVFHNAGGTSLSETAFTLAMGSYYLQQLTENGYSAGEVAEKILFRLAVGSDYFMEIAKFRAFRYLWAQILKAFGVSGEKATTCLHAENSFRNKTVYDPYVNMLRTTTENMSAILGGVDAVSVLPFDAAFELPSEMAKRVARNQQLILKEESYFDKVTDPAAGSYYIENLTAGLIEKSWQVFLEVDEQGGYLNAFAKGFIQDRIEKEARKKDAGIASRKISILGVNQFPNITEHLEKEFDPMVFETDAPPEKNGVKPLHIYRAAVPFEKLRYATDRFAKMHRRPRVWLFTLGDLAMRRAKAQFAENFFGCAGYEIIDHDGFSTAEEGIKAAIKDKPEMVVLCSDDKTYEKEVLKVFDALKDKTIVVLAGYPKLLADQFIAAGMEHFIHVRSNVLEELQKFNKILGIT